MNHEFEQVRKMHEVFGYPTKKTPTQMEIERAQCRYNWMIEECNEFITAVEEKDIVEQADAMIDLIYFALGTLVEMGIEPDNLFSIVQDANMSKVWPDGKVHNRADGKTIKPPTWEDPHGKLAAEISRQTEKK